MLSRRQFVSAASLLAGSALLPRAAAADARVEILPAEPIGPIAPEIYGHFVEHLGGVVYDGIWVGENSKIANIRGLRKDLVDALRRVKASVIRWPGGCFADQYDWRDGIGTRARRPRRTNFWVDSREWPKNANRTGPQVYDPNTFGTIEFARFCRATGAQPYFAANVRSLRPHDFWQWVEYCNSPAGSTTLSEARAADGEAAPLDVRYWGVGNESWGCGGDFTPEEYATEFRRFTAWVPSYGRPLTFIGSGPNGADLNWTRRFFPRVAGTGAFNRLWGWALHHYSWNASGGRTTDWFEGKGDALAFGPEQYYEILREGLRMDSLITSHWTAMGEVDRQHRVKLVVDEWGAWYRPGTEPFPEALLGQQNTMRDAVLAAVTLDIFHKHAGKVAMANIAQLVNCLQSLFLAHEDRFCATPTYHVFDMFADHQAGTSLRTVLSSPDLSYERNGKPETLPWLSASASIKDGTVTATVTNLSLDRPAEAEVTVGGSEVRNATAVVLAADDAHAHNSLAAPNSVMPRAMTVTVRGSRVQHRFPPASVTKLRLTLA